MPRQGVRAITGQPPKVYPMPPELETPWDASDQEGRVSTSSLPKVLDSFSRVVTKPTWTDDAAFSVGSKRMASGGQQQLNEDGSAGVEIAFGYETTTVYRVGSWLGAGYRPWTHLPPGTCTGITNAFSGWIENEVWHEFVVPAHPALMAGLSIELKGEGLASIASAYGLDVRVLSTQPTALRQGAAVGSIPADDSYHEVFIPGALVPEAGQKLYVGLQAGWAANYGDFACGWTWPFMASEGQLSGAGVPWLGRSGRLGGASYQNATWQVYTSSVDDIGQTQGEAGQFTWQGAGEQGSPDWGVDSSGLFVESTAPAEKGWLLAGPYDQAEPDEEQDDLPADTSDEEGVLDDDTEESEDETAEAEYGPWSDQKGTRVDVHFDIDAEGLTGQAGRREVEIVIVGDGTRARAVAHLGDGFKAAGVSSFGPTDTEYLAKAIAADTEYVLALDTRAELARAKLYAFSGKYSEPAAYDVAVALDETQDDGDRMELWARVGNATGSQRVTIRRIVAYEAGGAGDQVVGELVGVADGDRLTFPTAHRHVPGSVRPMFAGGIAAKPVREAGDEFDVDWRPTSDSIVRVDYVIADTDEGEDDEDDEQEAS